MHTHPIAALVALGAVLAVGAPSFAAPLASPAVYASPQQRSAQCIIGNVGSTPVTATVTIVDEAGSAVGTRSCVADPHFVCEAFANPIGNGQAYACTATITSGSASRVRGSMNLMNADGVVLRSAALH